MNARAGRPLIACLAGLLAGLGAALLVQQAGLWPLDRLLVFGLPALLAVLGIVLCTWRTGHTGSFTEWLSWLLATAMAAMAVAGAVDVVINGGGRLDGGCTVSAISNLDSTVVTDTSRRAPFDVDPAGSVSYVATSPSVITDHTWKVWVDIGGFPVTVADGGSENADEEALKEDVVEVGGYADTIEQINGGPLSGVFLVGGDIAGQGGACDGEGYVRFPGGALDGVLGMLGLGMLVLGMLVMVVSCLTRPWLMRTATLSAPPAPAVPARGPVAPASGPAGVAATGEGDPCGDLRAEVARARAEAERAQAAAAAADTAATTAREALATAAAALPPARTEESAAQTERDRAARPPSEGDAWIESEGRRITTRDLRLKDAASKAAWEEYRADPSAGSAAELEAKWKALGDEAALERLRELDATARATRLAAAEAALAAATAARAAAEQAEQAAQDAVTRTVADQVTADAEQAAADAALAAAEAALAECETRAAAAPPTAPGTTTGGGTDGGGGTTSPPPPTSPPTTPPPTGGGTTPPEEEEQDEDGCEACVSRTWVGWGWGGGGVLIIGNEYAEVHFVCVDDPAITISLSSSSVRFGLGIGGEASAFAVILRGPCHAGEIPALWRSAQSGGDGDLSIGVPIFKAARLIGRGAKAGKAIKRLQQLAKRKGVPSGLDDSFKRQLKEIGSEQAEGAVKGAARGSSSDMTILPVGNGLQVGIWAKAAWRVNIIGFSCKGENCWPDGY